MFKFFCCQFGCLDNHFRSYSHCFEIAGYLETTGSYTFFSPFFSSFHQPFQFIAFLGVISSRVHRYAILK